MDIQTVTQWMVENGFMVVHKDKYKVTAKFYEAVTGIHQGIIVTQNATLAVAAAAQKKLQINWADQFIKFIMEAEVPKWERTSRGDEYQLNKYSEAGMKAFRAALEKGADYKLLLRSTQLYYRNKASLHKAVGNYFAEGHWRTDYEALKDSALQGEAQLLNHLKESTPSNGTAYERG